VPPNLESPAGDRPDWDVLYRARGSDEVVAHRPIMTGDIFAGVGVAAPREAPRSRTLMVLQHPCSMRPDGFNLAPSLLVADVHPMKPIAPAEWVGRGRLMPLPELIPNIDSNRRHQVAEFTRTFHVHPDDLGLDKRIACLSPRGVILLFQRWVFYASRVVVPSYDFHDVILPVYEEIDLLEDWCEDAIAGGRSLQDAWIDVNTWLNKDAGGVTRRTALGDPQKVGEIRRLARADAHSWRRPVVTAVSESVDTSLKQDAHHSSADDVAPQAG
jgi:hypothetical protein